MRDVLQFAALGLGLGAIYALSGQGIVLIYRGSGVLNFAQGAMSLLAAWLFVRAWIDWQWPIGVALVVAIGVAAAVGAVAYLVVMRPLRSAAPLVRVIATLGLLAVLEQLVIQVFGADLRRFPTFLPHGRWRPLSGVAVGWDRLTLLAIAAVASVALDLLFRRTRFGYATRAAAENRRASAALGFSPDVIGVVTWTMGGALAGAAGVLIATISGVNNEALLLLVLPAMAAALVGRFQSFSLTLAGGLAIGIGQSLVTRYVDTPGWSDALPFLVIVVVLAVRGSAMPTRDEVTPRLPRVGRGRPQAPVVVVALIVLVVFIWIMSADWVAPMTTTLVFATVALSLVVLIGNAGQVSLGQFALAGVGAFAAARLSQTFHWPFLAALAVGIVIAAVTGLLFAVPSLRTRGVSLAVVTIGLALALEKVVFGNQDFIGGAAGTPVSPPSLFGWRIDALTHPRRYASVLAVAFVLLAVVAANARSGAVGRKLLAVRNNERAAAALGIRVSAVKFFAFGLAAAIAAVGGVFLGFRSATVRYDQFDVFASINVVVWILIGGVGFVYGSMLAALIAPGTLFVYLVSGVGGVERWLVLASGVLLIVTLIVNPDGLADSHVRWMQRARRHLRSRSRAAPRPALPPARVVEERLPVPKVPPVTLEACGITVRYGAMTALDGVSLTIRPGRITGLIGANGAGKTTFIDAVSGFTRLASGSILLDGGAIERWSAARRARAGVARTFQSLELFDDLTVAENLLVATDRLRWWQWAGGLVRPSRDGFSPATTALIEHLGLVPVLAAHPSELSFGTQRLLAVARAAAADPSVILLDEPAAGLDDRETDELGVVLRWLADERGMGILLVEHHVALVLSISDEVVAVDFGRGIFSGSAREASADAGLHRAYLGAETQAV